MQRLLNQVPINNIISQAETETETETETDTDTDQDRAELEHSDQFSGKTALIVQVQLGEYENTKSLLQPAPTPTTPPQVRLPLSASSPRGLRCARAGRRACPVRADSRAPSLCRRGEGAANCGQVCARGPGGAAGGLQGDGCDANKITALHWAITPTYLHHNTSPAL